MSRKEFVLFILHPSSFSTPWCHTLPRGAEQHQQEGDGQEPEDRRNPGFQVEKREQRQDQGQHESGCEDQARGAGVRRPQGDRLSWAFKDHGAIGQVGGDGCGVVLARDRKRLPGIAKAHWLRREGDPPADRAAQPSVPAVGPRLELKRGTAGTNTKRSKPSPISRRGSTPGWSFAGSPGGPLVIILSPKPGLATH